MGLFEVTNYMIYRYVHFSKFGPDVAIACGVLGLHDCRGNVVDLCDQVVIILYHIGWVPNLADLYLPGLGIQL